MLKETESLGIMKSVYHGNSHTLFLASPSQNKMASNKINSESPTNTTEQVYEDALQTKLTHNLFSMFANSSKAIAILFSIK